jgi:hypothetical protein
VGRGWAKVLERRYTELRHEVDRAMGSGGRVALSELVAKVGIAYKNNGSWNFKLIELSKLSLFGHTLFLIKMCVCVLMRSGMNCISAKYYVMLLADGIRFSCIHNNAYDLN